MRTTKLVGGIAVGIAVFCSVSVPRASAQLLSNKWFKLKFTGKGYLVDPTTGNPSKASISFPVYMHFLAISSNATSVTYTNKVWTETNAGWTNALSFSKSTTSTNNQTFFSDCNLSLLVTDGDIVYGWHTPFINIKTDKNGAFKSATYQGIGEIYNGTVILEGVSNKVYGSFSLTGITVETNKLPSGVE